MDFIIPKGKFLGGGLSGMVELLENGHVTKSPWPGERAEESQADLRLEAHVHLRLQTHLAEADYTKRFVQLLSCDQSDWTLTMEYMENGTLREYLRAHPQIDRSQRHRWILAMAEGLEMLHDHAIVYCDFTPTNMLLDHSLGLEITDFGGCSMDGSTSTGTAGSKFLGMIPGGLDDPTEWEQCRRADIYALRREREALDQLLLHSEGDAFGRHDYIRQRLLDLTACYFEFIRTSIATGACSSSELQAFLNELLRPAYDLKIISSKTFVDADPTWRPEVLPRCDNCDDDTPCCDVLLWRLGQTHVKLDSRIGLYWAAKKAVDHNMRCDGDILIHLERAYEDLTEAALGIEQRFGTRLASADRQLKVLCQLCDEIRTRDRLKEQKTLEYGAPRFVWTAEEDQTWEDDDVGCLVRARLSAGEELLYVQSSNEAMDEGVL